MPHSPAPWRREPSRGDGDTIVDANGDQVVGHGSCEGEPSDAPINNGDDWPLIIAAPKLLKALKPLVDLLQHYDEWDHDDELVISINEARITVSDLRAAAAAVAEATREC